MTDDTQYSSKLTQHSQTQVSPAHTVTPEQPPESEINFWQGMTLTILMVVIVRESCVFVCQQLNIAKAGNIVGLIVMFTMLFAWRVVRHRHGKSALPLWMTNATNRLLLDSGFAFLPVSVGAGLLLFALKGEFWGVVGTIFISTLFPLWGIAKLTDKWLNK